MRYVVCILFLFAGASAYAEPWLCTLPDGRKEFSYEPESAKNRNCVDHPMSRGYVRSTRPAKRQAIKSSAGFPRVEPKTQEKRDVARREILQRELIEERRALAQAVRELTELKHSGVTSAAPTVAKQYEEKIRTHQANISAIEQELRIAG